MIKEKVCPICNKKFTKDTVYCSKDCQYESMRKHKSITSCLYCNKQLTNKQNKFCSQLCFHNYIKEHKYDGVKLYNCYVCNKPLTPSQCKRNIKVCSSKCSYIYRINKYGKDIIYKYSHSNLANEKRSQALKILWNNTTFRNNVINRMTINNPMYNIETIAKCNKTKDLKHTLHTWQGTRGGNGRITEAEQCLYDFCINNNFIYQGAIATKTVRLAYPDRHYPTNYKPDFVNFDKKLCIEIDGNTHNTKKQKLLDSKKEECLRILGYVTVRFTNYEVLNDSDNVKNKITKIIGEL